MRVPNAIIEHPSFHSIVRDQVKGGFIATFIAPGSGRMRVLECESSHGVAGLRKIWAPNLHELIGKTSEFLRVYNAECGGPNPKVA